jgi:NADH-quinone oxidoreductase subunit H
MTLMDLVWIVVKGAAGIAVLLGLVAYGTLLERRVAAWIQDRVGPNRVGPLGLLQPIADGVKLLMKEPMMPSYVNKVYYNLAPCLVVTPALLLVGVLPFGSTIGGDRAAIADLDLGLLFVFAITSLAVYGIVLAGWASNSKYPMLGGVCSSAQMISYEVCIGLSIVGVLLTTSTMNLSEIVMNQAENGWLCFRQPLGCLLFTVAAFAETNRLPFDFPEAEQELVAGYHTEYAGMKFAMFQMGEYANMIVSAGVIVTLFFGGWSLPFAPFNGPVDSLGLELLHIGVFLAKLVGMVFFFMWVRWSLPRFRYDQLMGMCWNAMVPLSLLNLFITAAWITFGA